MERKLATIMIGDIVGSTSAMEADEESSVVNVTNCLEQIEFIVNQHGGRVFNTAGDASLAEFPSPVNALRAALASRNAVANLDDINANNMRFGLHLADVVEVGSDLKGDGVNLAARIQSAAQPGEIEISGALFDQVSRQSPCYFDDLGPKAFKGISQPIRIYRVRESIDRHRYQSAHTKQPTQTQIKSNSIAMTPLRIASSADEDQLFLAEGLTDDLTLEMSRLHALVVSARSSVGSLTTNDPVEIGKLLGVKFVLSGSVRKLGNRFRLNISLAETQNGEVIWADRIQKQFDEIFDTMDDIAARVAVTVSGRVEHAAVKAARIKQPDNMSAYEFYLRGIEKHRMGGVVDDYIIEALSWFEKSMASDPNYARPLAMHACSASSMTDFDIDKAEKMLKQALELDPSDPESHRIMSIIQIRQHQDYDASRFHIIRALKLAPSDAYVIGRCAAFHNFVGETERALELLDQAETLDPFLPVWVTEERVSTFYHMEKYDEMLRMTNTLPFLTRRTRVYNAAALVAQGELEKAKHEILSALLENPKLNSQYIISQELFEDKNTLHTLISRARKAGLPL